MNPAEPLRVAGLTRCTTIDYPGALAAVVFCQGCPWRCGYCHNPHLQPASSAAGLPWQEVLDFLGQRRGLLDAVVFSGGEPTLQGALPQAMAQVRALGFRVGLHTAGMYPRRLAGVLPHVDWIGLDIKGPWHRIDRIVGVPGAARRVRESLQLLLTAGADFECRTTWSQALFREDELQALGADLRRRGVARWSVQPCRDAAAPGAVAAPALAQEWRA